MKMKDKKYQHKRLSGKGLWTKVLPFFLLFPLSLSLFSSCEKVLPIEEPTDRQLVLNAVPAAGRQAFVHFAYTRFFLDNNFDQPIPNVSMRLLVNGQPVSMDSVSHSKYFFNHTLQEDDSLEISIQAAGQTVHAQTYVPLYPAVDGFTAVPFASPSFNFILANFTLGDHAGRDEYYNVVVTERDSGVRYNEWTASYDTVDTVQSTYFLVPYNEEITASDVCANVPLGGYLYTRLMFLDRKIDGQQYPVSLFIMQLVDTNEVPPFKHEYFVDIESVTPARFRYLISALSQNSMTSLFAEQGQAYSNVEGALGIFAGSAKRRFAFDPDTIPGMPVPSGMQVPPEIGRARHKSGF